MPNISRRLGQVVLLLLACCGVAQWPRSIAAQSGAGAIRIPFEQYTLPNGLTVILSPTHTTPTVAVDMWYHVGS